MRIGRRWGIFWMAWAFAWPMTANAMGPDQKLGLSLRSQVEKGQDPAILLAPRVAVKKLKIEVSRVSDGVSFVFNVGKLSRGGQKTLSFKQGTGTKRYRATVDVVFKGGEKHVFVYEFEATVVPALKISVKKKDVDLDGRSVAVRSTRSTSLVELRVFGDGNTQVGSGSQRFAGTPAGRTLAVSWTQSPANVRSIQVKVTDMSGFWASMEIRPFFVDPWEDRIYFETGSHAIEAPEEPKLAATLQRIKEALRMAKEEYGDTIDMRLYVAGYTDTVGSAASNRELSQRRARSIGRHLSSKGLKLPVFYQGFGEDVLAVSTPDNTAHERNRRTLYVLSSQVPVSNAFPRSQWKRLK